MDKLKTYTIEITETLQQQIPVKAENLDVALQKVKEDYYDEKIWLDENNLVDLNFDLIESN